jgi:hypothetical protein
VNFGDLDVAEELDVGEEEEAEGIHAQAGEQGVTPWENEASDFGE